MSKRSLQYLKERNIRLVNMNINVGIITFIAGILLSDQVKNILKQWLEDD